MADKITEIIDQAAFDQVTKLKNDMKVLAETFAETFKQAEAFNSALKAAKGLPEYTDNTKKSTAATSELEKITRQLAIAKERLSLVESEQKKQLDAVRISLQESNAASKDAIKLANAEEGSLDALKIKLKQLQAQYSALGEEARKALGPDLLKQVQNTYNSVTQLEKSMGQYSRNVGNYKNETFQLTQVLREVPAFTYSATTGVLALSNNLPMLADGFGRVAAATNEATGKVNGIGGALKIFGSSLLSFGSIFSIAIGLFTIFSKEIFGLFNNTKGADEATKALGESVGRESGKFESLTRILNNHNLSKEAHIRAAKELKELYPKALANYDAEAIAAGKAAEAINRIKDAIIANAKAKAAQADIEKKAAEQFGLGAQLEQKKAELELEKQNNAQLLKQTKQIVRNDTYYNLLIERANESTKKVAELKEEIADLTKKSADLDSQMSKTAASMSTFSEKTAVLGGVDRSSGGGSGSSTSIKKRGPSMQALEVQKMRNNLQQFKGELSPEQMAKADKDLESLQKYITEQGELHPLKLEWDFQYKLNDFIEKLTPIMKGISDAFGAAANIGNEVAGLMADKANAEADMAIRNIDRIEKAQLESLSHLTMSQKKYDEEKKKIEVEAEQRRKKTERDRITAMRKAAAVQKAADVASILSSTAAAIVGMLKNPGGYPGVALSIAAGITGGLQLARAVAAPLPQYAEGTDNHPGGAFIAGEKGHEVITMPDGRKILTADEATLYPNMPKGTKVTSNEELMQQIYNSAIVKLATGEVVTSSKMEAALIESLDELSTDFKDMKRSVEALKLTVNISGDYSHIAHVKSRVR